MALAPVILKTNPHRPVDFKESSVLKVFEESGSLSVEVKEDGCQLNLVVLPNGVHALSRAGKQFPGLWNWAVELHNGPWAKFWEEDFDVQTGADLPTGMFPNGFLLQAEVVIDGMVCAEISGQLATKGHSVHLIPGFKVIAFDLIPIEAVMAEGDYEVFQNVRRMHTEIQVNRLKEVFPEIQWELVVSGEAFDLVHLDHIYETYRRKGKEGAVAKDPLGYWKRGKRTGQWKVKPDDSCDGVVVGLMWGTPGLANEGRVIGFKVLTEHGVEVEAGGITESQKDEYTKAVIDATRLAYGEISEWSEVVCHEETIEIAVNPFEGHAVQITYMERLPSGSYRHPNFDQFRGITDPMTKE